MSLSNHLYLLGAVKLKGTRTNGHGLTVSMEYEGAAMGAEVSVPPLGGTNTIERLDAMLFFMGKADIGRLDRVLDFLCEPLAEERCASYGFAFLGVGWVVKETIKSPSVGRVKLLTRLQVDVSMHDSNWLSVALQKGVELEHVVAVPRDRDLLTHSTLEFGVGLEYRVEIERLCRLCTPKAQQQPEGNGDQQQLFDAEPAQDVHDAIRSRVDELDAEADAHDLALQRIAAHAARDAATVPEEQVETAPAADDAATAELLDKLFGLVMRETEAGGPVTVGLMTRLARRHGASDDVASRIADLLRADGRFVLEPATEAGVALSLVTLAEPTPTPEPAAPVVADGPKGPLMTPAQVAEMVETVRFMGNDVSADDLAMRGFFPLLPAGKSKRRWALEVLRSLDCADIEFEDTGSVTVPTRVRLSPAARLQWLLGLARHIEAELSVPRFANALTQSVVKAKLLWSPSWVKGALLDGLEEVGFIRRQPSEGGAANPYELTGMSALEAAQALSDQMGRRFGKPMSTPSAEAPAPEASVPDAEADALAASQTRARVAERTAELCRRQDMGSMRLALLRMRISAEFGAETPTLQELEDLLRERSDVFSLVSVGTAQKGEMLVCLR